MSIATLKKKTTNYMSSLTKRSGKPPGGYWLPQGPFGTPGSLTSVMLEDATKHAGPVGFSLQGSHRSISVGKDMKFSKQGTPYRGKYPIGWGGTRGRYYQAEPVLNAGDGIVTVEGNQWEFVHGSRDSIFGIAAKSYLVSAFEDSADPQGLVHQGWFILVDTKKQLRGAYDGTKNDQVNQLMKDMELLLKEEFGSEK